MILDSTIDNEHYTRDSTGRLTKKSPLIPDLVGSLTSIPPRVIETKQHEAFGQNTRPLSSLSNFEFINHNQFPRIPTPFESTPSDSPITTPPKKCSNTKPLPQDTEDSDIMATEHVDPFHGDKEDENLEDFLRSFFRRMGTATDDIKKRQFKYFLQADSTADEWFKSLQVDEKKDWDLIEDAFNKRWPRKKAAKKTTEEYEEEITGLRLKTEDLGKKEKTAGREVYSHIAWADKMATIVKGAKIETTTTYIGHVRRELPKLLREKLGAGHGDWTAFLQAVRDVDTDYIRDGADIWKKERDEQDALRKRIQQLEKLTASPTAPLRQQMMTFGIGSPSSSSNPAQQLRQSSTAPTDPFAGNNGGRGNLVFQAPQTGTPPQNTNTRPPATQADRTARHCSLVSRNTHTTRTPKQVDKPTKRSRQIGQRHMAPVLSSQNLHHTPSGQGHYQSVQMSVSPVDSQDTWVDAMVGHAGTIEHSTPTSKLGEPYVHEFSSRLAPVQ